MRPFVIACLGIAGAAAVVACSAYGSDPAMARTTASDGRACFYASHVRGFQQGPGDSIIVRGSSRNYFLLEPYHRCGNINVRLNVAIRPRGGGFICEGYDADLYVPGVHGYEYCPVRAVRKLTPAEVQALRATRR